MSEGVETWDISERIQDEDVYLVVSNRESLTTTKTVEIEYSLKEMHDLTIDSTEGGEVIEPGEGDFEYEEGTVVDLEAEAEEDYEFVGWIGNIEEIDDPESAETTIEMLDDYSITAEFEKVIVEYTLTIESSEGGEVIEPGEGDFEYEEGTVVDLEAEAEEGYEFVGWTGNIEEIEDPESAETTIEMLNDYSITAEFDEVIVTEPDIQWTEDLAVDGETDEIEIEEGDEVKITAELENVGDETGEVTLEVNGEDIGTWDIEPEAELEIEENYEFEDDGEYDVTLTGDYVEDQSVTVEVEEEEKWWEIPGFTIILLILGTVITVAIYKKKKR